MGSSTSSPYRCYGHSKAGIILVTRQLAKRYPTIISLAPHPGPTRSNLTREMQFPKAVMWFLNVSRSQRRTLDEALTVSLAT